MPPTLDIIVVNWNAGQQLRDCLQSIVTTDKNNFTLSRVVVVDNHSDDGSVDHLERIALPLKIIRNHGNCGFAVACNQAAKSSQADYLLLLNPDTRLFNFSLSVPIAFLEKPDNRNVGIAGVQLVDEHGHIARTSTRFPTAAIFFAQIFGLHYLFPHRQLTHFMHEWDHGHSRPVDHIMAAFALIRRAVYEQVGGMDERYFVYYEDLDFSFKVHQAGYTIYFLAAAQVFHRGGGTSAQVKAQRLFYSLRSRLLYGYKHFSAITSVLLTLATLFVEPVTRLIFVLIQGRPGQAGEILKGYGLLWRTFPQWADYMLKGHQ